MTPYTRWYDYLIGAAVAAGLMLAGAWLDRPLAPVCGTDTECLATLDDDERAREFRANVNREAKARNERPGRREE